MKLLYAFLLILMVKTACCQNIKVVDVEFLQSGKKTENVSYYIVKNDTATKLSYDHNKISIPLSFLNKRKFNMVAVYNGKAIYFGVNMDEFHYIKISNYRSGLFKPMYSVNIGSEYDELVKPLPQKKVFRKYIKVE